MRNISYLDYSITNMKTFHRTYSDIIRDYLYTSSNPRYDIIDYYNDIFFYRYVMIDYEDDPLKRKNYYYYIIQKGVLRSTQTLENDTAHKIQYTLTNGAFYGVYIPDSYGLLRHYEFIDDGILLIFEAETFYLKINKSCPKAQVLNQQEYAEDIFRFKYDENLLTYENPLYDLADISKGYIYFLRDNIKKVIYYDNGQYYLTSDITKRDVVNNINLTLNSSQSFLGEEAYFGDKKIVLTTETKETSDTSSETKITKNFVTITYDPSAYNLLDVERSYADEVEYFHDFSKVSIFDDKY